MTTRIGSFLIHKQAKNDGDIKCEICKDVTTQLNNRNKHMQTEHCNKVRYSCDQCDYITPKCSHLIQHNQTEHD